MRIYQILRENGDDIEKFLNGKFSKEFKDIEIYHGSGKRKFSSPEVVDFHYREHPRDTALFAHEYVNQELKNKFGIPIRSLLFCTKSKYYAETMYGNAIKVIPDDSFRMFASKDIQDFTTQLKISRRRIANEVATTLYKNDNLYKILQKYLNVFEERIYGFLKENTSVDDIKNKILECLKDYGMEDISDNVKNEIKIYLDTMFGNIKNRLDRYIEGVVEITSQDQLYKIGEEAEIMVYSKHFLFSPI